MTRKTVLAPLALAATSLVGALCAAGAPPAAAAAKPSVRAYIFAWRQVGSSLVVAYLAHAAHPGVASCTVHARPTVKLKRPYFWSFPAQRLVLRGAPAKAKFVTSFAVPVPADKVAKVWVHCQ